MTFFAPALLQCSCGGPPRPGAVMNDKHHLGGVIHTYQKYDPAEFPSPTAPPPDLVSPAFDHLLTYGSMRRLTPEELARAVRIDPSQIKGLGPSLQALTQILEDRKRKILETYETHTVQHEAHKAFHDPAGQTRPPDKLLEQLKEAMKTAQIGIIDLDELSQYVEPGDVRQLGELQQQIQEYLRQAAEQQGLEQARRGGFQMTPRAYRLFQSRLLSRIFEQMQASKTGRHPNAVTGEGAVELPRTKEYEFGDSVAHLDVPGSFVNALLRGGPGLPVRLKPEDLL